MADNRFIIKTNSKRDIWIQLGIILLISLIFVLLFFFVYLPWTTNHGESISVPDLKGMKLDEIEEYLEKHDLRYEVQDSAFDLNLPPLSVKDQYPKANAKVKKGRKIYLTVIARTPRMVTMPKLKDLSQRYAEMTLKNYKLQVGNITYKPYLGAVVLEQSVESGQKIAEGSRIDLVIGDAKGSDVVIMPDLVGKTREESEFLISGSGLIVGSILTDEAPDKPPGTINRQRPVAGEKIKAGDIVDLWITPGTPQPLEQTQEP